MTEKINIRSLFTIMIAVMLSVSFTSCLGNDDEEEAQWIEEPAIETGLCGPTWVWEKSNSESDTNTGNKEDSDTGINPETTIIREMYVFNLSGNGSHEYTYSNGETKQDAFIWKSYRYGTNHLLSLIIEGYDTPAETLYAIENMTVLRIMVVNETGTGTTIKEFRAE